MYYFHGQLPAKKRFDEIYVSVKFSNFDSQSLIPDFFINWALFNPNYSSYLKALGHSLSVTVPVAKKQYDEWFFNGKFIILFDDVRTSGASLEEEKSRLESFGAKIIGAITIAQTQS